MGRKLRIKFPLAFQATEFGDEVPRPGRRRAYAEMRAQRALTIAITVAGAAVLAQKHRDMGVAMAGSASETKGRLLTWAGDESHVCANIGWPASSVATLQIVAVAESTLSVSVQDTCKR